jgi:hypothetical protein
MNGRTIGIIVPLVIVAGLFLVPRLFNRDQVDTTGVNRDFGGQVSRDVADNIQIGRVVSAWSIDRDGCATETTSTFRPSDPIYVVAEDSTVPAGTSVFVRIYREGQAVEDTDEIVADQDYNNSCINFVFESNNGFDAGRYEAEFYINGNPANSVQFEVR